MSDNNNPIGATQEQSAGTGKRILLNFTFFAVAATIAAFATTEWLAVRLGFHPALSGKLADHVYQPWAWAGWVMNYRTTYPDLMQTGVMLFSSGLAVAFALYAVGLMFVRRRSKPVEGLHGTARWATRADIQTAGLLTKGKKPQAGVYVGGWWNPKRKKLEYLRHDGPEHVLAFAPTRSGKGVGLVLPTLLSWMGSCVVYDIKGENWALTAGWRRKYANNVCLKFEPTASDGSSAKFNPLAEIRLETEFEVADTQNIATMIIDPDGKGLEDHWAKTGQALLTATILHICYVKLRQGQTASLADIGKTLANPDKGIMEVLEEMRTYPHKLDGTTHPLVQQEARSMLNKPEKEMGSVVSTVESTLTLYRDPVVQANTSTSDFNIKDLMHHITPVSLYLVVRPSDEARLRPLIRLIITQIVNRNTEMMGFENGKSKANYKHRLLVLLDEFASLGRLTVVEKALSFAAGYGIKFYLIIQDIDQINAQHTYGRENGIMGNCHVRIAYAPNKLSTAEELSKLSGTSTVLKKQITTSGKRHALALGQVSESWQETSRPLITADEVMCLPMAKKDSNDKVTESGHMLIFVAGNRPIYGRQILYFRDPVFLERAKVEAPRISDALHKPTSVVSFHHD